MAHRARMKIGRALAGLAMVAVLLAGCAAPPRAGSQGQSVAHAKSQIESIPGVASVRIDAGSYYQGFKKATDVIVAVSVAPGYHVTDGAALTTFLVRTAWSLNGTDEPNDVISIGVTVQPGDPFNASDYDGDWASAAPSPVPSATPNPDGSRTSNLFLGLDDPKTKDALGPWPGAVPTPPTDAIAKR